MNNFEKGISNSEKKFTRREAILWGLIALGGAAVAWGALKGIAELSGNEVVDFQSKTLPFRISVPSDLEIDDHDGIDNKNNTPLKWVQFIKRRQEKDLLTNDYVVRVRREFINLPGGKTLKETKDELLNGKAKEIDNSKFVTADDRKAYALQIFPNSIDLFFEDADTGTLWRIQYDAYSNDFFNKNLPKFEQMVSTFKVIPSP